MESRPSILVVVATHTRPKGLAALLEALRPQVEGHTSRRMVVVNDGTHDAAYDAVVAPHSGWLDYRIQPRRLGPGPARQAGCDGASEDVIVFSDDDCIPPMWWLDRAEALACAHPTADLFGGYGRIAAPTRSGLMGFYQKRSQVTLTPAIRGNRLLCVPTPIMMVRRQVFEQAGGFPMDFHDAAEDTNLTYHIMSLGCLFVQDPYWVTTHHSFSTLGQSLRRWHRYGYGNAQHLMKETDPAFGKRLHPYLVPWSKLLKSRYEGAFQSGASTVAVIDFVFRVAQVAAYRSGIRAGMTKYSKMYDTEPPTVARPADGVAAMVVEGAVGWERAFTRWRRHQEDRGTRARPVPAATAAAARS